jgi:hypothetical protein
VYGFKVYGKIGSKFHDKPEVHKELNHSKPAQKPVEVAGALISTRNSKSQSKP